MQHGWSIPTSAGLRFASAGWISLAANAAFGFMLLFGRSHTTTLAIPRSFGFTITVSSRIGPFFRHAGPFAPPTASGLRFGIGTFSGNTTRPLSVTHAAGWPDAPTADNNRPTHASTRMGAPRYGLGTG